ncbi:MAG: class II aldolase/adducin family protein [Desulfobacteraceae bacterium]|nr:class II aldolase/adducin family protein [Desulfobacteraceae bacterium]
MKNLINKYEQKCIVNGLASPKDIFIAGLNTEIVWNQDGSKNNDLEKIFSAISINSLMFVKPMEPYFSIIEYLIDNSEGTIYPSDTETRTFLHDLPIINDFNIDKIIQKLKQRKCVIVKGEGIITWGSITPEQAYIFFSCVCFTCFVKFFVDCLNDHRKGNLTENQSDVLKKSINLLDKINPDFTPLKTEIRTENDVYKAISEAGRIVVDYHLVDSFFGNVSYKQNNILYISQTGSSLDELAGCVDPCPLDDSACSSITASSEFSAHKEIVLNNPDIKGLLHGHPKFTVIMSMYCEKEDCTLLGQCHIKCPEIRHICNIPIVCGEVGTGVYGLCNTLPKAIKGKKAVIVYGHGVFASVNDDFNNAFKAMIDIEQMCKDKYFDLLGLQ